MPAATTARSARLGLRATPAQETVLRRAAEVAHKSLTDFHPRCCLPSGRADFTRPASVYGFWQPIPGAPGNAGSAGVR